MGPIYIQTILGWKSCSLRKFTNFTILKSRVFTRPWLYIYSCHVTIFVYLEEENFLLFKPLSWPHSMEQILFIML